MCLIFRNSPAQRESFVILSCVHLVCFEKSFSKHTRALGIDATILPVHNYTRTSNRHRSLHQHLTHSMRLLASFRRQYKRMMMEGETVSFLFFFLSISTRSFNSIFDSKRNSWKWKCAPRPRILCFRIVFYGCNNKHLTGIEWKEKQIHLYYGGGDDGDGNETISWP